MNCRHPMTRVTALCVTALLAGLSAFAQESPEAAPVTQITPVTPITPVSPAAPNAPAAPAEPADPVEGAIAKLDRPRRYGQLMIVTLTGRTGPSYDEFSFLEKCAPGGVIIQQVFQPATALTYTARLRPLESSSGIPLWVGANLYRLSKRDRNAESPFMQVPSMLAVGATGDVEAARRIAEVLAGHMTAMGFDFYLGPSLELAPTLPDAPGTIHVLGGDPAFVAEAGPAMIAVLGEKGVLAMPLGFPGGGQNRTERSAGVLLTPKPLLEEQDLFPWRRAVEGGVEIIHVGDTLVPTLDELDRPACLSSEVMTVWLREKLGFHGVIVAGPMDSPEVERIKDPAAAAVDAIEAGADMVLWNQCGPLFHKSVIAVDEAISSGRLPEAVVNASLRRIITLKQRRREAIAVTASAKDAERLVSRGDFMDTCLDIERSSITLVRNEGGVLPLRKDKSTPVVVTGVIGVAELKTALEEHLKPIGEYRITTAQHVGAIEQFEIERITRHLGRVPVVVCVLSDDIEPRGAAALIDGIAGTGAQVVLVHLGYPRYLARYLKASGIVLGYCDPGALKQTMTAVADVLAGEALLGLSKPAKLGACRAGTAGGFDIQALMHVPAGRIPVTVPDAFPLGFSVSYDAADSLKKLEWDFGNGEKSREPQPTVVYAAPGTYTVTVNAADKNKHEASVRFDIQVLP